MSGERDAHIHSTSSSIRSIKRMFAPARLWKRRSACFLICLLSSLCWRPSFAGELHDAVRDVELEQVKLLLAKGAQVNEKSKYGVTPLHIAARQGQLHWPRSGQTQPANAAAIVEILLEHGADVNVRNVHPKAASRWKTITESTPLHKAAVGGNKETMELLLAYGADVNAVVHVRSNPHYRPRRRSGFVSGRVIVPDPGKLGSHDDKMTPLHYAVWRGHADVICVLLNHGAAVNSRDVLGRTPLHLTTYARRCVEVAKVLIEQGADVTARTIESGKTPIISATATGKREVVEFLLANGADAKSCNIALRVAKRLGKTGIAAILRQHGAQG